MSFLSVQCIPSGSCHTEFSIPHLHTVMGVCGPSGALGSDGGSGEAEIRCGYPRRKDPSYCLQQMPDIRLDHFGLGCLTPQVAGGMPRVSNS